MEFEDQDLEKDLAEEVAKQAKRIKDKTTRRRLVTPDPRKMRNLRQYKNMTDAEFEQAIEKRNVGVSVNKDFESRIQRKMTEFGVDYDLDDLNSNDKLILRALSQAMINLEDIELETYAIRSNGDGLTIDNLTLYKELSKVASDLRSDISKLQDDLKITRKVRKSDKDQSTIQYIEDLKRKAKEFYESKMQLVFCPKCNTWIGSIWYLYPTDDRSYVVLHCNREMEDGTICGERIKVSISELIKNGGTNKIDVPMSIL
jgi:hypothetical protein